MTGLRFQLGSRANLPVSAELPVEIRKPNMALVARTLSSDSVELAPGTYFVTTRLPDGQEISHRVRIDEADEALSVELVAEGEAFPESPGSRAAFRKSDRISALATILENVGLQRTLESSYPERVEVRLRLVAGNVLRRRHEVLDQWPWSSLPSPEGHARLKVRGRDTPLLAQVLQPDLPPFNIALPARPEGDCVLVLVRLLTGHIAADIQLEHTQADLLLRYREEGLLGAAEATVHSRSLDAEELLHQRHSDPVATAVRAYSLLRWGEHDRLRDWTENLKERYSWFPDGAAIRGEHLARLGRHEEALAAFLELPERGLPLFSGGVSYTLDRLRLYAGQGDAVFPQRDLSLARDALDRLQQFVTYIDFGRLVTTFTGLDPGAPNAEPLRYSELIEDSIDVGQLFVSSS